MNQGNARIAGASAFRIGFLAKVILIITGRNPPCLVTENTFDTLEPLRLDLEP